MTHYLLCAVSGSLGAAAVLLMVKIAPKLGALRAVGPWFKEWWTPVRCISVTVALVVAGIVGSARQVDWEGVVDEVRDVAPVTDNWRGNYFRATVKLTDGRCVLWTDDELPATGNTILKRRSGALEIKR